MTAQRVLVVDDEPGIRKVLRAYLEREGFGVDEAVDGPSALTRFEDELHGFKTALANRDWPEIRARLERGKAWRDGFRP